MHSRGTSKLPIVAELRSSSPLGTRSSDVHPGSGLVPNGLAPSGAEQPSCCDLKAWTKAPMARDKKHMSCALLQVAPGPSRAAHNAPGKAPVLHPKRTLHLHLAPHPA